MDTVLMYDSLLVDKDLQTQEALSMRSEDAALVSAARTGDTGAFEDLVRRYRNDVFAVSYHFLRDREAAWDVSQEVFVKAWHALKRFRGDASFKTWLLRIASNHCKDYLKKRRLKTVSFDDAIQTQSHSKTPTPAQQLENAELGAAIEAALDTLPEKHRSVFLLREYEDLSYNEIADVLQCSVGTVMSRLFHARKKLQSALIESGVVEDSFHA